MSVASLPQTRPPIGEVEGLVNRLGILPGAEFTAACRLVMLLEAGVAPRLSELDRLALSRLLVSTGHSIGLSCEEERRLDAR